jgi:hypothetical protein
MADHAFVTWVETPEPWAAERELIAVVDLPLNLDQNRAMPSTPNSPGVAGRPVLQLARCL